MAFQFPWTNFHELNLDWFLSKFKQFTNNYLETTATVELIPTTEQPEVTVTGGTLDDDTDIVDPFTFNFKLPINSSGGGAVNSVNGKVGDVVLDKTDIGLGNVANVAQYSASNPPPYPVTSVNGMTGDVIVQGGGGGDVLSVNDKTGTVILYGTDIDMSSDESTDLKTAIDAKADSTELNDYLPLAGGTMMGAIQGGTVSQNGPSPFIKEAIILPSGGTEMFRDIFQGFDENNYRVFTFRGTHATTYNQLLLGVHDLVNGAPGGIDIRRDNSHILVSLSEKPASSQDSNVIPTTSWVKDIAQYRINNVVNIGNNVFAGYFDSSKNLYFFIPLNKNLSGITNASISTDTSWAIFCAGSAVLDNTTLASFGTITCTVTETGVLVKVVPSNTSSITARETVTVRANTARLTLS